MVTDRVSVWVVLRSSNPLIMVKKLICKIGPHLILAQLKEMGNVAIKFFISPKIKTKQVEMTIGVLFAMKYVFLHFRYTCLECGPNGSQTVVNVCVQGCVAKYEFE